VGREARTGRRRRRRGGASRRTVLGQEGGGRGPKGNGGQARGIDCKPHVIGAVCGGNIAVIRTEFTHRLRGGRSQSRGSGYANRVAEGRRTERSPSRASGGPRRGTRSRVGAVGGREGGRGERGRTITAHRQGGGGSGGGLRSTLGQRVRDGSGDAKRDTIATIRTGEAEGGEWYCADGRGASGAGPF
jgi:hypothetical protein